jgi:hypothetical protein
MSLAKGHNKALHQGEPWLLGKTAVFPFFTGISIVNPV